MNRLLIAGLLVAIIIPLASCARMENTGGFGELEEAVVLEDYAGGDRVMIERSNGEIWLLEARTRCSWTWMYEGKIVLLKFGRTSSRVVNGEGEVCDFLTEKQIHQ